MEDHSTFIAAALEEARAAARRDEVPVGAVLVERASARMIACNGNRTIELQDPGAHAEMLVIREGCRQYGAQRIPECNLYVTLEPCAMCAAVISFARIGRLVIGAEDSKGGGVLHGPRFYEQPTCHHRPEIVSGILAEECGQILKDFFRARRDQKETPLNES